MDIRLAICRKTARCSYCLQDITIGEPVVRGRSWRKRSESEGSIRRWIMNFRWHGKRASDGQCCWLAQELDRLSTVTYVETRGRKKIILPKEQRERRLHLLRKRARQVQRLKHLLMIPTGQRDIDDVIKIGMAMEEIKEEIVDFGGVPKSW